MGERERDVRDQRTIRLVDRNYSNHTSVSGTERCICASSRDTSLPNPEYGKKLEYCPGRDLFSGFSGIRDGMDIPSRHPPSRESRDMSRVG